MNLPTRMPRGLRAQVTLSLAGLVMLLVGLAGVIIALRIDHRDRADVDRQLTARTAKVRADADKLLSDGNGDGNGNGNGNGNPATGEPANDDYGGLLAGSQSLVRLLSDGTVVAERGDPPAQPLPIPATTGFSTITIGNQPWRSLVVPADGTLQLQVLQSLDAVDQRRADNTRIAAAVALAAATVSALGVWLVAGLVLQPLQRLRIGARRIRPADLDSRLPAVTRPQEVAELSNTLNSMLGRLQAGMLATRRFTSDAGHELRTPLTALGMDLETLSRNPDLPAAQRRELLDSMTGEHQRIVTLLDGLQALARGDAGVLPARVPIDLADLVGTAVDQARRRHPGTTYHLAGTTSSQIVEGWDAGLHLALRNLLDNAALHGRPAGSVHVTLEPTDAAVHLVVADDGPGIPPDRRDAMRGRFIRGDRPRSAGSGLGLALVDQQATLHGGSLHLDTAPLGGLQATLVLPRGTCTP